MKCAEDLQILWIIGSVFVDCEANQLQITGQMLLILSTLGLQKDSR